VERAAAVIELEVPFPTNDREGYRLSVLATAIQFCWPFQPGQAPDYVKVHATAMVHGTVERTWLDTVVDMVLDALAEDQKDDGWRDGLMLGRGYLKRNHPDHVSVDHVWIKQAPDYRRPHVVLEVYFGTTVAKPAT
jgi:hypothetical protein